MRKPAFQAAAALALVASMQAQTAHAQQAQSCLTRPEMRGLIAYFLPTVLQSAIATCRPRLDPDSYLLSGTPRLLDALEAGRSNAWPMAKQAVLKIGDERSDGAGRMLAKLPEEAIGPMVGALITEELSSEIKAENCGDIDRVMAPLDPLPTANLIDMATEVMVIAGRDGKKIRACRES